MRTLRALIMVPVALLTSLCIVLPVTYLYVASSLPNPIDSEEKIELVLRQSIESERQSVQYAKRIADRQKVDWPAPDFSMLPSMAVALYVTENGCPGYFQSPRETTGEWRKRVIFSLLGQALPGDGECELIFAQRVATRLGARSPLQLAVTADRLHAFLSKEQLVAYDLHSMHFARAVVGIEAASSELMQKPLLELTVPELAELALAIPPHGYWSEVWFCKNAGLIVQNRDAVIGRLHANGFIDDAQAEAASELKPRCLSLIRGPGSEFHPQ